MYFKKKTKLIYNTKPKQFMCRRCKKGTNVIYIDGYNRYCPECFEGKEEDYDVIEEFNKGGWLDLHS